VKNPVACGLRGFLAACFTDGAMAWPDLFREKSGMLEIH
jgi:hypothetical protein